MERDRLRRAGLRAAAALLPPATAAQQPPRLLLIRPDHLGDVLFLTPALHALRRAQPDAHITALVGPWAAPLLRDNPAVNRVETLPFPWFDRQPKRGALAPYRLLATHAHTLRGRFDVAIVARWDFWWGAWLAAWAGIPRRIGYRVPGVTPFLTEALPYEAGRHEVLQNLRLTARLGTPADLSPAQAPLRFPAAADHTGEAATFVAAHAPAGAGPLVAIHPGSGAPVKRWRVAHWHALMDALHATHGARFLVTGGPGEEALAAEVAAGAAPARSVAGQTPLPLLAALFARCALVLGPDSGPLHLAVAMGRPTVHLYGPVSPALFGPWGEPSYNVVVCRSLACQFCHHLGWTESELPAHPCVRDIPVAWVLAEAARLLHSTPPTGQRGERG